MPNPVGQIEAVARREDALKRARARAAGALRRTREQKGLSLRQASERVGLSAGGLSLLERAMTWETETARRVAAAYANDAEPDAQPEAARAA
jgi:transcriptional regulator with XRE-family HTH domain